MSPIFIFIHEYLRLPIYQITKFEFEVLVYIDSIAPAETAQRDYFYKEFFSGAYVFIPDNGQAYQAFAASDPNSLTNRDYSSSHYSLNTQYSSQGSLVGECLFGTTTLDGHAGTWVQLEAYSSNLLQVPAHLASYISYIFTGYNHGPHGYSEYTEKSPLILNVNESLRPLSSHHIISTTIEQNDFIVEEADDNTITLLDVFSEPLFDESLFMPVAFLTESFDADIAQATEINQPIIFTPQQEEIILQPEVILC
ncbi:MAG: hypothetical protein BGO43_04875 [Gammaproteobacteria bacterium 39-13]|nr:hypothetical protein [Gammaproteobacteria bacterium]OJV96186.1 MAG: hypothetical protein BGO43_04875 [Gammaproteobacteria bacterium 39-13]